MTWPANGGCNNKFLRFTPNTLIACSSADSVNSLRMSRSRAGNIKRLYASATALAFTSLKIDCSLLVIPRTMY